MARMAEKAKCSNRSFLFCCSEQAMNVLTSRDMALIPQLALYRRPREESYRLFLPVFFCFRTT